MSATLTVSVEKLTKVKKRLDHGCVLLFLDVSFFISRENLVISHTGLKAVLSTMKIVERI